MGKNSKSKENNQWASLPEQSGMEASTNKKDKTATDNQWTSTAKNNLSDK